MNRLTRDGTIESVSGNQYFRRERGQGKLIFPVQLTTTRIDWQPYPVDPYSAVSYDHTMLQNTYRYILFNSIFGDGVMFQISTMGINKSFEPPPSTNQERALLSGTAAAKLLILCPINQVYQ